MQKIKVIYTKYDFILLLISVVLFLYAIFYRDQRLIILLLSGIFVGLFYGAHNNLIWGGHEPGYYENIHNRWVHFIGGIIGAISAYLLMSRISFGDPSSIASNFEWADLALFLIMVLGYTGYIPRTLWFIANKGGIGK